MKLGEGDEDSWRIQRLFDGEAGTCSSCIESGIRHLFFSTLSFECC